MGIESWVVSRGSLVDRVLDGRLILARLPAYEARHRQVGSWLEVPPAPFSLQHPPRPRRADHRRVVLIEPRRRRDDPGRALEPLPEPREEGLVAGDPAPDDDGGVP